MFFTIIILFYLQKIVQNTQKILQNTYYNMYPGYDERYPLNETGNAKQLINIKINLEKKELLDILQNSNLSNAFKLMLLHDYNNLININIQFRDPEWE